MNRLIDRMPFQVRKDVEGSIFTIDNVAEYFFSSSKYDKNPTSCSWKHEDFPNIAPPFHCFWMEYNIPSQFKVDGKHGVRFLEQRPFLWRERWRSLEKERQQMARETALTLIEKARFGRSDTSESFYAFETFVCLYFNATMERLQGKKQSNYLSSTFLEALAQFMPEVHWILIAAPFISDKKGITHPIDYTFLGLDRTGAVIRKETDGIFSVTCHANNDPIVENNLGTIGDWQTIHWIFPSLLAISLLHCKNVQPTEHRPNKKASAHHRRLYGAPLTKYYTLEIDPMKKVLREEGQSETLGLKKALHICRGHFSEYGPEFGKGKLFGKLEGRYWIPQHVKGSAEHGVVEKDYSIKAPEHVS